MASLLEQCLEAVFVQMCTDKVLPFEKLVSFPKLINMVNHLLMTHGIPRHIFEKIMIEWPCKHLTVYPKKIHPFLKSLSKTDLKHVSQISCLQESNPMSFINFTSLGSILNFQVDCNENFVQPKITISFDVSLNGSSISDLNDCFSSTKFLCSGRAQLKIRHISISCEAHVLSEILPKNSVLQLQVSNLSISNIEKLKEFVNIESLELSNSISIPDNIFSVIQLLPLKHIILNSINIKNLFSDVCFYLKKKSHLLESISLSQVGFSFEEYHILLEIGIKMSSIKNISILDGVLSHTSRSCFNNKEGVSVLFGDIWEYNGDYEVDITPYDIFDTRSPRDDACLPYCMVPGVCDLCTHIMKHYSQFEDFV